MPRKPHTLNQRAVGTAYGPVVAIASALISGCLFDSRGRACTFGLRRFALVGALLATVALCAAGSIPVTLWLFAAGRTILAALAVGDIPTAAFEMDGRWAQATLHLLALALGAQRRGGRGERLNHFKLIATIQTTKLINRHLLFLQYIKLTQALTKHSATAIGFSLEERQALRGSYHRS